MASAPPAASKDGGLVSILFLVDPGQEHKINRATAAVGGLVHGIEGSCHAEIGVPHKGTFLSSSIYQGETVSLTPTKTFANPGYKIRTIAVSAQELNTIKNFIQSRHAEKVGFDRIGMMLAALPFQLWPKRRGATFCSRYVTEALQAAGLECVAGVNPAIVTPTRLYKILGNGPVSREVAGSVGFKQAALGAKATIAGVVSGKGQGTQYARLKTDMI